MALLQVENLQKSFGKEAVIKGVDFTLEKGEVLAIIGASGSGKTTLLRCLNFLEVPEKGIIRVGGTVLFDADDEKKRSEKAIRSNRLHFGLVFQQFNLFPQYNVLKNVTLASQLLLNDKLRQKKKELGRKAFAEYKMSRNQQIEIGAQRILKQVGLIEKITAYPCELSGGQQQRVAIARALALKPDILCFDEPTSALDPELTGEVLRAIKALKSNDRTMIVVTHEMEFAKNIADKIIFMVDGVIEEEGTPNQVFGSPRSEKTKAFLLNSSERYS